MGLTFKRKHPAGCSLGAPAGELLYHGEVAHQRVTYGGGRSWRGQLTLSSDLSCNPPPVGRESGSAEVL